MQFIKELIENYKIRKDFKSNIFGGIEVIIAGENIDKIYGKKEYESISKRGPFLLPVRIIKDSVYDWCNKVGGIVRIAEECPTEYNCEIFYFSRKKDAIEFKKTFDLIGC